MKYVTRDKDGRIALVMDDLLPGYALVPTAGELPAEALADDDAALLAEIEVRGNAVPRVVTPYQLRVALRSIGKLEAVEAWRDLGPMLARAVARTPDKPDVLARLLDRSAQLWAVIEAKRPIAGIVTELTETGGDRWCRVWLVAGERVAAWVRQFIERLEPWARACGCLGLWASGRDGWARLARQLGWKREGSDAGFPRWTRRF